SEVDHVLTGRVAVEDLEQEEVDGGRRVEDALAPAMLGLAAGFSDRLPGQSGGDVLAQAVEDGDDARRHGWGSVRRLWVLNPPTRCPESLPCTRCSNSLRSQNL